jgi:hypothetical protein
LTGSTFFRWTAVDSQKRRRTGYGVVNGKWVKRIEEAGQRNDTEVPESKVPDKILREYDEVTVI